MKIASKSIPQQPMGQNGPMVSRIALGCMGLTGTWNPSEYGPEHVKRAIIAFEAALEAGITLYDHADIYGGTTCETVFKECLSSVAGARDSIYIATKCGICTGYYNLTYKYILEALDRSLERMGVEYVDIYQMHRPDPLTHPAETARALNEIVRKGKAKYVGVSNYYPEQVRALKQYLDVPLATNQISISLRNLAPIYDDGVLDQCMALQMTPLAYSPLAKASLTTDQPDTNDPLLTELRAELRIQGQKYDATPGQIALAWLLAHPAGIIPLVGSARPEHIREAVAAARIGLTREDWYALWVAGRGKRIP